MFAQHLPLSMMTDLAAYALPLDLKLKQQLLAERHVDIRAQLLLEHLERNRPANWWVREWPHFRRHLASIEHIRSLRGLTLFFAAS